MTKIGFVGLGHMGNPMAHHLLRAKHELFVFDVLAAASQKLVNDGAIVKSSVKEIAKEVDILITMVQTGDQVKSLCLGDEGIFANARTDLLFIDCSSIDIEVTRQLHTVAKQAKIAMLDAPVSGGVAGAEAGSLTFMVGGDKNVVERALPILQLMGKKIVHAGKAGTGQAAKICNNLLLGISMIGVCEAFSLAEKLGLEAKNFFEISSNASGQCWSMTKYCPVPNIIENVPSNHDYAPGFAAKMMLKDLRLAQGAAEAVNSNIPLGSMATELYQLFVNDGNAEQDFSGIINFISKQA